MCTGACSKFVAIPLYVLVLVSVVCNILLFFPDFDTKYAQDDGETTPRLTAEVKYMGGVIGGGIMALIPAIHIHLTGTKTCCANRCGIILCSIQMVNGLFGCICGTCSGKEVRPHSSAPCGGRGNGRRMKFCLKRSNSQPVLCQQ
uniref:Transmembrane 4 L6 family member 1-like n=1 Tax=Salarias fasciatus TaxID=181472 RepID=A0A672GGV5_SALFA